VGKSNSEQVRVLDFELQPALGARCGLLIKIAQSVRLMATTQAVLLGAQPAVCNRKVRFEDLAELGHWSVRA
jgi:hypothetical protein